MAAPVAPGWLVMMGVIFSRRMGGGAAGVRCCGRGKSGRACGPGAGS